MSKIAELITAKITGDVKAVRTLNMNLTEVRKDTTEVQSSMRRGYRIECRIGSVVYVDDGFPGDSQEAKEREIMYAIETVKRGIIEEIFGEFKPILREMAMATYDEDTRRLRSLLSQLEQKMFYDGI
jgi:hypothetical protein